MVREARGAESAPFLLVVGALRKRPAKGKSHYSLQFQRFLSLSLNEMGGFPPLAALAKLNSHLNFHEKAIPYP